MWLNDRATIWTPFRRRENRFGAFGAGDSSVRQPRQLASSDELLIAAMQASASDQVPHAERIGARTRPDRDHGAKQQEGINQWVQRVLRQTRSSGAAGRATACFYI